MDLTHLYREKDILINNHSIILHVPGFIFPTYAYTEGLRYGQVGAVKLFSN